MAIFDNFAKLNTSYFSGSSSWLNDLNSYFSASFGWNSTMLPGCNSMSLFNFNNFDFSNIFSTNIWNTNFNSGFNFNTNCNLNNSLFNNFSFNFNTTSFSGDTFSKSTTSQNSSLKLELANTAKSYVGKVNSDKEGNRLFSGGNTRPWCADFVSYVAKKTYGSSLPSSFKNFSSVNSLREWGEANNCYKKIPSSGKANFIAQNVKVGDIMIEKNGGKSHTGIVTKVNSDGSFETVEGNCNNKVATQRYTANSSTLSGFISLDKYTA